MKPFLQNKEKKVWVTVILLQLSSKEASVYFDQDGRPSTIKWLSFLSIDILYCCAIIYLIFWSISFLESSRTNERDSKIIANLNVLRFFRSVFILYVGFFGAYPLFIMTISMS